MNAILSIVSIFFSFVTLVILIFRFSKEKIKIYHQFHKPIGAKSVVIKTNDKEKLLNKDIFIFSVSVTNPSIYRIGFFSFEVVAPDGQFLAKTSSISFVENHNIPQDIYYCCSNSPIAYKHLNIIDEGCGFIEPLSAMLFQTVIDSSEVLEHEYVSIQMIFALKSFKRFIPIKKYRRTLKQIHSEKMNVTEFGYYSLSAPE